MTAVSEQQDTNTRARVAAILPLALLESIRIHDRPREVLEDEDLTASLPRRLGLTGVIASQIHRYREAHRRGRQVPQGEVRDLLQLVLRRPDAEDILREAGRLVARDYFGKATPPVAAARRIFPRRAALAAARRAARRLLRRTLAEGETQVSGRPFTVRIRRGLPTDVDGDGAVCTLYGGVLEELLHLYTRQEPDLTHERCCYRGAEHCEWVLPD